MHGSRLNYVDIKCMLKAIRKLYLCYTYAMYALPKLKKVKNMKYWMVMQSI